MGKGNARAVWPRRVFGTVERERTLPHAPRASRAPRARSRRAMLAPCRARARRAPRLATMRPARPAMVTMARDARPVRQSRPGSRPGARCVCVARAAADRPKMICVAATKRRAPAALKKGTPEKPNAGLRAAGPRPPRLTKSPMYPPPWMNDGSHPVILTRRIAYNGSHLGGFRGSHRGIV